jgi:GNAT superfamily N-acetyltransferase
VELRPGPDLVFVPAQLGVAIEAGVELATALELDSQDIERRVPMATSGLRVEVHSVDLRAVGHGGSLQVACAEMDAFSIRPALSKDLDGVWELTKAFAISYQPEENAFAASFSAILDSRDVLLLVAEGRGRVVGYALAETHPTLYANGPVAWVEELMVEEGFRRIGVGGLLMGGIEDWAKAHGCSHIALATTRASAFYEAIGYGQSAAYFRKVLM